MSLHIETEDYRGRRITCNDEDWYHICEHDYMENAEEQIINALKNPYPGHRWIDKDYTNRRAYYYKTDDEFYTKVVVEFQNEDGEGDGEIITAFQPDSMKPGEKPEW